MKVNLWGPESVLLRKLQVTEASEPLTEHSTRPFLSSLLFVTHLGADQGFATYKRFQIYSVMR